MPQTWTFVKKAGAPAGAIRFETALGYYTIDDVSNTTIVVSTQQEASELLAQPMLTLQGSSGGYTPPPTVQTVQLVGGKLSKASGSGAAVPFDGSELPASVLLTSSPNAFTVGGHTINPVATSDNGLSITMPAASSGVGLTVSDNIAGSGTNNPISINLYGIGGGLDIKGWTPNASGGVTQGGIPLAIHQYGSPPAGGCAARIDNCGNGAGLILASTENSNNAPTTWGNGPALQWNTYNGYTTYTGATVTGNNTVSDVANAPFLPNCVGKPIIVGSVKTTIATYVSASQVTTVSNALVNGAANVTYSVPLKANVGQLAYMTLDPVPRSIGGGGFLAFVNAQTGTHARSADPWSFVNSLDNGASALYVEQAAGTTAAAALLVNNLGNTGDLLQLQSAGSNKFRVDNNGSITRMANATMTGAGSDGNFIFGTTTGTKIGTLTTQKLAFWNATPIVQPTGTPAASTDLASVIALANSLRTNLLALGLVA